MRKLLSWNGKWITHLISDLFSFDWIVKMEDQFPVLECEQTDLAESNFSYEFLDMKPLHYFPKLEVK